MPAGDLLGEGNGEFDDFGCCGLEFAGRSTIRLVYYGSAGQQGADDMKRLRWGLIGGGEGSQIGFVHRAGAELDRQFELTAGTFDVDPERSVEFGRSLGLPADRVYRSWPQMLRAETARDDRLDLVTVATPNSTHFEICRAFIEAGFHVFCEKPLTTTLDAARRIEEISREHGRLCAVNFGYTGYPLVRQMRSMVAEGVIGRVRLVKAEFAAGFLADANIDDNPRIRWRFDPEQAGESFVMADMGCHAMCLATFVTGQRVVSLSADFGYGVEGRRLEDDAAVAFRMSDGAIGRLWVSGLAIGRTHGLTLQVFGEKGGLSWEQEHPEQLRFAELGGPVRILERGMSDLSDATMDACRITVGHPEGMVLAFANLYRDLSQAIRSSSAIGGSQDMLPDVADGRHMVEVVSAAVESSAGRGEWRSIG